MCGILVIYFYLPVLDPNSVFNYVWSMYKPSVVIFVSMTVFLLLGFLLGPSSNSFFFISLSPTFVLWFDYSFYIFRHFKPISFKIPFNIV